MKSKPTPTMEVHSSRSEVMSSDTSSGTRVGDQREQGNDAAIRAVEESLSRAVISHGPCSDGTREVATHLVLAYNHFAMKKLSENDIKGSLRLLQKAKLLTSHNQPFLGNARLQARALTLNNLGCLMKKWGKPREGIKFLARALRIEAEIPGSADNPAGTHVNMSAALSTLGFHRAAAAHAGHAIGLASQAMTIQEEGSSFVASEEEDSNTTREERGDDATPGSVEGAGKASDGVGAVVNDVDVDCGGGGSADPATARVGEAPENSRKVDMPPLKVEAKDGETIDSVGADDGCSPETSSSLPSANDPGRGISDQEEQDHRRANPENGVDHEGASPERANNGLEEETSSIKKQASSSSSSSSSSAAGGLLAIAYFNLGVEREYLGQLEAALSSYEEARFVADQHLGPESPVAKGIEAALEKVSAALVAAARYSSERAALRARLAVSSFPSIGQLQFGQRTPAGVPSSGGGRRPFPRRRVQPQQHGDEANSETSTRDLLQRAYSSPRPHPAPCRVDSWARIGHGPLSPRSPSTAPGLEPGGGPQRAGRWTKMEDSAARPAKAPRSGRGGSSSERGFIDEDLRWRALACAEWQCSPRDALQAQQTAHHAVPAPK